ncbi:ester cyclase [Micromonospora sp. NPDC050187]|uniref:ester cyclase n=1 Tax=Micromonospora sp. NPDC050187 TaxID=3364277 RepID=UPI0037A9AE30
MRSARELVESQYAMLRQRDLARLPELYADDAFYSMPGLTVRPIELPAVLRAWSGAFPDLRTELTGLVETAGGVVFEQRMTGTHTGALHTALGAVAPTGRAVSWDVVDVVRARHGLIASWRSYFDQGLLLTDLGWRPEPAADAPLAA